MNSVSQNSPQKQMMVVGKVGPAFSVNEVQAAHRVLDEFKVPRTCGERMLSLPGRISFLAGKLEQAERINAALVGQEVAHG